MQLIPSRDDQRCNAMHSRVLLVVLNLVMMVKAIEDWNAIVYPNDDVTRLRMVIDSTAIVVVSDDTAVRDELMQQFVLVCSSDDSGAFMEMKTMLCVECPQIQATAGHITVLLFTWANQGGLPVGWIDDLVDGWSVVQIVGEQNWFPWLAVDVGR